MKYTAIIVLAIVLAAGCSPKTTPQATATAPVPVATEPAKAPEETKPVSPMIVNPKDSPEALAGSKTYNAKCGRCHELKKVDDFTAKEWVPILNSMAPKSRLDSTEKANVLLYVQTHAKGA